MLSQVQRFPKPTDNILDIEKILCLYFGNRIGIAFDNIAIPVDFVAVAFYFVLVAVQV